MSERIDSTTIVGVLINKIKHATKSGETLKLKYHPLESGRARWELLNQGGDVILGNLDKQRLLDAAERAMVNICLEEFRPNGKTE